MTEINPKLLGDLARLAARYSPEDWRTLLEFLGDETRRFQVVALLEELHNVSSTRRARSAQASVSSTAKTRRRLEELKQTDPRRSAVLSDLWRRLRDKEVLPQMSSVRAFCEAIGIKSLKAQKREQAVSEVIDQLATMPYDQLESALTEASRKQDRALGDEYERWVGLILADASRGDLNE
jgi:hypothetical protein